LEFGKKTENRNNDKTENPRLAKYVRNDKKENKKSYIAAMEAGPITPWHKGGKTTEENRVNKAEKRTGVKFALILTTRVKFLYFYPCIKNESKTYT